MLPCSPCLHLPHPGITGLQHHARLLSRNIWCCCHSTHRHRDLKSGSTTEKVALNVLQSTVTCAGDYATGHKDLQEDLIGRVSVQRVCTEYPPASQQHRKAGKLGMAAQVGPHIPEAQRLSYQSELKNRPA